MKRLLTLIVLLCCTASGVQAQYTPAPENLKRRAEFEGFRLGIFIHWGIYSTFAQGEWYLNYGLDKDEYAKAADAFYPHRFDARAWVQAFRDAGAGYVTFTSRHHDGFSMWNTRASDYNIVRSTPFGRDVLKELSEACEAEGLRLHLYYSLLGWIREDYPVGRTGLDTGRRLQPDYDSYFGFMKRQIHELLTEYGPVGGLWFDGYWDHDKDAQPFDWRIGELYDYIHTLRPEVLIGNNHHLTPIDGEDFQMFERDLPGENKAGLSGQDVSELPLEMCQTMNGMWGYKVADTNYKSTDMLIELIVRAAAKGSNLLLNIGPQPNGELPAESLDRLRGIGEWMRRCGESVRNTRRGEYTGEWGVSTRADGRIYLHVLERTARSVTVELAQRPREVTIMGCDNGCTWRYDRRTRTLTVGLPDHSSQPDAVVQISL